MKFKFGKKSKEPKQLKIDVNNLLAIGLCVDDLKGLYKIFNLQEGDTLTLTLRAIQVAHPAFVDGIVHLAETGKLKKVSPTVVFDNCTFDAEDVSFMKKTLINEGLIKSNSPLIVQQFSINVSGAKNFHVTMGLFLKTAVGNSPDVLVLDPKSQNTLLAV